MPKKLLIYGSEFSKNIEDAVGYCWEVGDAKPNWKKLIEKKNKELDRLHEIYKNLIKNSGCDLFKGYGKLISSNEVLVTFGNEKKLFLQAKL